jgi:hypothetical protein
MGSTWQDQGKPFSVTSEFSCFNVIGHFGTNSILSCCDQAFISEGKRALPSSGIAGQIALSAYLGAKAQAAG